ncbi:carbohydrate ABC transporter permease [Nocardioides bruguierae]|uniref:Carbohydrate ABC transporter permease n=1 Tax=Nocardioides bruguierae TaxID=2945102 RepID=A0A9X2DBM1_9ACTN|nr:carbohydrate ABC transporter permease [Nocardioides bruguierae]MCL8026819.1 carbohydrate ABC transporter permease [Nocardioides bruguierae]MCM0622771.1 carbohydrate ABC transporter permease [Nocardioides bruguierae]
MAASTTLPPTTPSAPDPSPASAPPTAAGRPGARSRGVLWHVVVIALVLVVLYPVFWLVSASFKPAQEVLTDTGLWPANPTGENYATAMDGVAGYSVWRYLGNSLVLSLGAVIGNVFSCTLAGYAFGRLRFRGRGVLFAFMLITIMLPIHVVLIPQYIVFQQLGLVNTFWPILLPKLLATDAFFIFLVVQFVRSLPRELDEAALIDGAGPFRTFWYVIAPLLRPAMFTTAIFSFIWTWNDFFTQLIYLNSPENYTLSLALKIYVDQTSSSSYGPMFAMSILALVPVGLFFMAFQRLLVEGVATQGLKG